MYPTKHMKLLLILSSAISILLQFSLGPGQAGDAAQTELEHYKIRNAEIAGLIQHGAAVNDPQTGYSKILFQAGMSCCCINELLEGYEQTPSWHKQTALETVRLIALRGGNVSSEQEKQLDLCVVNYIAPCHAVREQIMREALTKAQVPDDLQRLFFQFSGDAVGSNSVSLDADALAQLIEHRQPAALYTYHGNRAESGVLVARASLCDLPALHRYCQTNSIGPARLFFALLRATEQGSYSAIECLIKAGAAINGMSHNYHGDNFSDNDYYSCTPLMSAALYGTVDSVRLLLAHDAWVNVQNHSGLTALHCAVESGDITKIRLLLAHGADPKRARNCFGLPLQSALRASPISRHIVQMLLDAGSGSLEQIDQSGQGLLDYCGPKWVGKNFSLPFNACIIKWLMLQGIPVNNVRSGHSKLLWIVATQMFIEDARVRCELSDQERAAQLPEYEAWKREHQEIVRELAIRGARLDEHQYIRQEELSAIQQAHGLRMQTIAQLLGLLDDSADAQDLIREFSDDALGWCLTNLH